jgi:hypothetical protein
MIKMSLKIFKAKNMLEASEFNTCYTANTSYYLALNAQDKLNFVKRHFPDFIENEQINFDMLKTQILAWASNNTKFKSNSERKAIDLFKTIYAQPFICTSSSPQYQPLFETIMRHYGDNITAHGVEESKGGLKNIFLMAITGKIAASSMYWGALVNGLPNISPVPHGPYYLIASTSVNKKIPLSNLTLEDMQYILVPFDEIKISAIYSINILKENGLLDQVATNILQSKLITYQEFHDILMHEQALTPPASFCPQASSSQSAIIYPWIESEAVSWPPIGRNRL